MKISKNKKKETCKKRQAQCFYCNLSLDFNKLTEHMNFCGSRTEKCRKCNRYVQLKNKNQHEDTNCEYPEKLKSSEKREILQMRLSQKNSYGIESKENNKHDASNILPCEFCDQTFSTDELIQHQVGLKMNAQIF